jgi:hypothetical protein
MVAKGNTSEGKALLELGKKAAAAVRDGSAEALDMIEAYVSGFTQWEATWKVSKAGTKQIPAAEQELAQRIAHQHAQIVRLTGEMHMQFVESLKGLRVKGKGLKKYIDQLPQRMSTINKKG